MFKKISLIINKYMGIITFLLPFLMLIITLFWFYIEYKNEENYKVIESKIGKFEINIDKLQYLVVDIITNTGNSNLLTGENKKLWLKYKPELIKKGKDCYLYRIRFKNIVDKKLYKFAYDYLEREKMGGYPLYIKGYYNSREKCKKEDYEDCNIYLMEKGIKVYDDDYECDNK